MYLILKQASNTENVWSFYTENGVLWTAATAQEAATKIESIMETSGVNSMRLIRQIDFTASVAVENDAPEDPIVNPPEDPVP